MVVLVTCKSLNALQPLEGSLKPVNHLCRAAQQDGPGQHACHMPHVCSGTEETDAVSLPWDLSRTDREPSSALLKPGSSYSAFVASESVASIGQCALDVIPRAFERSGRPNECHIIL